MTKLPATFHAAKLVFVIFPLSCTYLGTLLNSIKILSDSHNTLFTNGPFYEMLLRQMTLYIGNNFQFRPGSLKFMTVTYFPCVTGGYHWCNHILIWPIVIRVEVESTFSIDNHMPLSLLVNSGNFGLSIWNLFIVPDTGPFWLILGV